MTCIETHETPAAQSFEVTLQLISPVCLASEVPAGNLTRTLHYIPGSAVRGALAALHLESGKPADETFERLFLTGDVTYGNCYLDGAGFAPLSARSCKYEPGFIRDEDGHGVVDWLLPSFTQEWREKTGQTVKAPKHETCAHTHHGVTCDAPLERFKRFYWPLVGGRKSTEVSTLCRVLTRSAIDDRLQGAEQGLLYSLEVLDPTTAGSSAQFRGLIRCSTPDGAHSVQCELLNPLFEKGGTRLFMGAARSRGLGEVKTVGCQPHIPPYAQLPNRLHALNQCLNDWGVNDGRTYFSFTLHSDTIIQDEYYRFHGTIPPALLAWEAGFSQENTTQLELEICFSETRTVSGWNSALHVPKNNVTAIKTGAVFLYSVEGMNEQDLINKLAQVEVYGLGARRTEGFGRIVVCDPFHIDAGKEPI